MSTILRPIYQYYIELKIDQLRLSSRLENIVMNLCLDWIEEHNNEDAVEITVFTSLIFDAILFVCSKSKSSFNLAVNRFVNSISSAEKL